MERLLDKEDKVRSAAVAAICEAGAKDLRVSTMLLHSIRSLPALHSTLIGLLHLQIQQSYAYG